MAKYLGRPRRKRPLPRQAVAYGVRYRAGRWAPNLRVVRKAIAGRPARAKRTPGTGAMLPKFRGYKPRSKASY